MIPTVFIGAAVANILAGQWIGPIIGASILAVGAIAAAIRRAGCLAVAALIPALVAASWGATIPEAVGAGALLIGALLGAALFGLAPLLWPGGASAQTEEPQAEEQAGATDEGTVS